MFKVKVKAENMGPGSAVGGVGDLRKPNTLSIYIHKYNQIHKHTRITNIKAFKVFIIICV